MTRGFSGAVAISILLIAVSAAGQNKQIEKGAFETTSLLGRKLYALPDDDGSIRAARENLAADPNNVGLVLKLSKAEAAKRQYREAVETCTAGLKFAPKSAELYLERGHRELGLREFNAALADLNRAVELDPKMLDAQYHQGTAHYFLREFDQAAASFGRALDLAQSSDSVIDCSHWRYVSLRRAGQAAAAKQVLPLITPDIKNKEPHLLAYLRLLRFYKGELTEAQILPPAPKGADDLEGELAFDTINYAVGNWHLYNDGNRAESNAFFRKVVRGAAWNAWGFIGSEVELAERQ